MAYRRFIRLLVADDQRNVCGNLKMILEGAFNVAIDAEKLKAS